MNPSSQPMGPCPCGSDLCDVVGTKIARKTGHLVGCRCRPCRGSDNQRRGKGAQDRTTRALTGTHATHHEESGRFVDLTVRPEVKAGQQVPESFRAFVATEWVRRAISQAERSIPVGVDARPAVSIDGRWLLVDLEGGRL